MTQTKNKRKGLRKLECDCGAGVYATFSQLERFGLPRCGACGECFMPADLEVAVALRLEDSLILAEYYDRLSRFVKGQAGSRAKNRNLRDPETVVAQEFEADRRKRALANRLSALRPAPEPMPF